MFNLIPEDWGGYVRPWVVEFSRTFVALNSLHFRRMIVLDEDLELIGKSRGRTLHALRLDKCSGFSTDGLLHITSSCRYFYCFFMVFFCQIRNWKFICVCVLYVSVIFVYT